MIKDGKVVIGTAGELEIAMIPSMMNRHGLIAGASGTGKTCTLKAIAESLSELGVPTFIADVKGDLTGMIQEGNPDSVAARCESMGLENYGVRKYPVHFYDVYREKGHPIRAVMQDMDPVLLSRILELTDAQKGVLNIIFKCAEDMELDLIDLKDLQAMTEYVGQHTSELTVKYGTVAKQSVGAIQRKLLVLEQQGGAKMFGMPAMNIDDLMCTEGGLGMMNILESNKLFQYPMLYSTFLLWLLDTIYTSLPEVGDLEKPKMVFFFDEAHLLFSDGSKELQNRIEQIIKLIRSKGVGVFFITQSPADIPAPVLAQVSNRIQHSLRAYTPTELKAVKQAADSFRDNPDLDEAEVITNMKTGQALVSVLDAEGAPTIVQKTKIVSPRSSMNAVDDDAVLRCVKGDSIYGKYEKDIDPESAYERMEALYAQEEEEKALAAEKKKQEKLDEAKAREEAKAQARKEKEKSEALGKFGKKIMNRVQNEAVNYGVKSAKKLLKAFLK